MSQGIGKLEEGGVSKRGGETDEGVDREEGKKRKGERERDEGTASSEAIIRYSTFIPASLAVKNPLAMQETWFNPWIGMIP